MFFSVFFFNDGPVKLACYSLCFQPFDESGSPQQLGLCGENTQCLSGLPGAQTSGDSHVFALVKKS